MDVCLTLFVLSPCLTLLANGHFYSKPNVMSSEGRIQNIVSKDSTWYWNPSAFSEYPEFTRKTKGNFAIKNGEHLEFEKAVKAISSLDISKSIELVFDPKIQALIPTAEIPMKSQNYQKKAYETSIVLLSPKTYIKLKKVFENLKREEERNENNFKDYKNFQTGRFKSKYFRTVQT